MDITLRQAELFLALAKTGNITAVAKEHFLTQSAVSIAIKRFESALGSSLFDRAHRKLTLNSNGQLLYDRLFPLMEQFQEIEHMFSSGTMAGSVLLGASATLADYLLPQVLFDFQLINEEAHVSILTGNSRDIVRAVETGEVPVGFIENEVPSKLATSRIIGTEEMVIVTADRHFAAQRIYHIEELLSHLWILREPGSGTRETFSRHLGELWGRLHIFMELDHMSAVKQVLRNKGTLSCLSPHSVGHELAKGALYPVQVADIKFTRNFYSVVHPKKQYSLLLESLITAIEASVGAAGELLAKSGSEDEWEMP